MKFDWEKFKKEKIAVSFENENDVYDFAYQATQHGIWIKFNGEVVFECIDDNILDWGSSNSVYYDYSKMKNFIQNLKKEWLLKLLIN